MQVEQPTQEVRQYDLLFEKSPDNLAESIIALNALGHVLYQMFHDQMKHRDAAGSLLAVEKSDEHSLLMKISAAVTERNKEIEAAQNSQEKAEIDSRPLKVVEIDEVAARTLGKSLHAYVENTENEMIITRQASPVTMLTRMREGIAAIHMFDAISEKAPMEDKAFTAKPKFGFWVP